MATLSETAKMIYDAQTGAFSALSDDELRNFGYLNRPNFPVWEDAPEAHAHYLALAGAAMG